MGYIYIMTNKINDKIYIGQTKRDVDSRLKNHRHKSSCTLLSRSIEKYGIENFQVSFFECPNEELDNKEKATIKEHREAGKDLLNLTPGGGDNKWLGKNHKEEARIKMSISRKGKKQSKEWVEKRIKSHIGSKRTEESKQKMSNAWKNKQRTRKSIILIHPDGTEEKFNSIKKANDKYNFSAGNLSRVLNGKANNHKGYKAKYATISI
jgi:group I intron endonuclease